MMRLRVLGAVAVVIGGAGCDLKEFTVSTTAPVLRVASDALAAESDVQLARDSAPASLKTVEGFYQSAPKNRDLLHILSQGYIEYTFGFLEDDLEAMPDDNKHAAERDALAARATGLYDRANMYASGWSSWRTSTSASTFRKDVASAEAAAKKLDKDAAPGLLFDGPGAGVGHQLQPQRPGARRRAAQGDRRHQALATSSTPSSTTPAPP